MVWARSEDSIIVLLKNYDDSHGRALTELLKLPFWESYMDFTLPKTKSSKVQ